MQITIYEVIDGDFLISSNKEKLNVDVIHDFLRTSYWSEGIGRETVEKSINGAVCYGLYHFKEQIGFARVITDGVNLGYIADVFVLESYQGRGLGQFLMRTILKDPSLQGIRKWMLATHTATTFYEKFGFVVLPNPRDYMEYKPQNTI